MQGCSYRLVRVGIGMCRFGLWTRDGRCLLESPILLCADDALKAIERTRKATGKGDRYWWRLSRDHKQQVVLLDDNGQFLCASLRSACRSILEADLPLMQHWGPCAELFVVPTEAPDAASTGNAQRGRADPERRQRTAIVHDADGAT